MPLVVVFHLGGIEFKVDPVASGAGVRFPALGVGAILFAGKLVSFDATVKKQD